MRGLLLAVAVSACAHQAAAPAEPAVVAGELIVGTVEAVDADAVLGAVALEGYRFEYVAAASQTSHLVRVLRADGSALSVEGTRELVAALQGREGVKYVELNSMRQPR